MNKIKLFLFAVALAAAGVSLGFVFLSLASSNWRIWREALVVIAGIEFPLLFCALFDLITIPVRKRQVPMYVGDDETLITLPPM